MMFARIYICFLAIHWHVDWILFVCVCVFLLSQKVNPLNMQYCIPHLNGLYCVTAFNTHAQPNHH